MADSTDKKRILDALKLLREECKKYDQCYDCPFCHEIEGCMFKRGKNPKSWTLSNERTTWRAFKD